MISTVNIQGTDYPIGAQYDNEGNVIADTYALQDNVNQQINDLKTQIKQAVTEVENVNATITNLADDEDLASVDDGTGNNVLKFADRTYNTDNFSGKGYKILRKNIQDGKNILTQDMINQPNTIYEIRYDFDLNGGTINLLDNCILKFEGGCLNNGHINFNNTSLETSPVQIFNNIEISGEINIDKSYCEWFGGGFNCDDSTNAIKQALKETRVTSGTTDNRPTVTDIGFQYFDTTINKPIWWTGTKWVDATGVDI